MTEEFLLYNLALQHINNVGDITAKKLIKSCGSAKQVFLESESKLQKIEGIGQKIIRSLKDKSHLKDAEEELKFIKSNQIEVLYFEEDNYPKLLKQCIDSPILLFKTGNFNLENKRIISIVGTRRITTSGISFCEKLIEDLAPYNPIIISGFAYGTDITAQKAAIKHQLQTIGCLAHGLNQIYPKTHKKYVASIEACGGFLSDFWSSDTFDRNNFLKRNRLIAGISEATIVIESAEKGGSLVTADIANSYSRDVFAVPGRPSDAMSTGCNNLIKNHKAHALTTPLDVPYILNWQLPNSQKQTHQTKLFIDLEGEEKAVYNYLKTNPKSLLDEIAINCNLPIYKMASLLLTLELKGVVKPIPGKLFDLS